MIYVVFEDQHRSLLRARARPRTARVSSAEALPAGVVPTLGPDATGVGHVFWYTLDSPTHSLRELRSLQDWFVRYQLNAVPGVAEVASVGGHVQQYQIDVDPNRLRSYGIPLGDVVAAVRASNPTSAATSSSRTAPGHRPRRRPHRLDRGREAHRHRRGGRRPRLRRAGGRRAAGRRVPGGVAGEGHEGSGGRRRRRPVRRQHQDGHRCRQGAHRADPAGPAGRRHDRAVLRPLDADRAGGRDAAPRADRRDPAGHARARHLPDALPLDPDRHAAAAARRAHLVPRHVLRRASRRTS